MYRLEQFFAVLDSKAPIRLSEELIRRGDYDNSGILIKCNDNVKRVLFTLDLSESSVKRAKYLRADTIVTHHPAIFYPIKNINIDGATKEIALAVKNGMNVISMHLNLDCAENGIDATLCAKLKGTAFKILDPIDEKYGYGREFGVENKSLINFVKEIEKEFATHKIIYYGKKNSVIKKVASFCGAGASHALSLLASGKLLADTIVTSDAKHHEIKGIIEKGKNLVLIPHYVSEEAGFKEYAFSIKKEIENFAECFYFDDKRFR